jgi:SAM-dependent methyltransferase
MSTQYDAIGAAYNYMKLLPAAKLERANLHSAVAPYIKDANVLDLACGTGYYSRLLLDWGAKSVIGIDISQSMIDVAQSSITLEEQGRLSFRVGDCSKPARVVERGLFDLVVGAWLLNYAPSGAEMADMFRNAALNLRPGGHFIGITPYPTDDLSEFAETFKAPNQRKYGVSVIYKYEVPDGFATHVTGHTEPVEVQFDNFHLRKSVYEKSARDGGMDAGLAWKSVELPSEDENKPYGVEGSYWDGYMDAPHFGILDLEK